MKSFKLPNASYWDDVAPEKMSSSESVHLIESHIEC
jgi:hypothetical protein